MNCPHQTFALNVGSRWRKVTLDVKAHKHFQAGDGLKKKNLGHHGGVLPKHINAEDVNT
jgi:hypothetical protein